MHSYAECILLGFDPLLYVLFCHSGPQDSIGFLHIFHALTLISDRAWIILAWGRLYKYWISRSLTTSLPLSISSHTLASHSLVHIGLFCQVWFGVYFWLVFSFLLLRHTHAHSVYVCVLETDRDSEWVHIMNNAWCGFLVSETDGGDGELPLRSFFPITYCS